MSLLQSMVICVETMLCQAHPCTPALLLPWLLRACLLMHPSCVCVQRQLHEHLHQQSHVDTTMRGICTQASMRNTILHPSSVGWWRSSAALSGCGPPSRQTSRFNCHNRLQEITTSKLGWERGSCLRLSCLSVKWLMQQPFARSSWTAF